jgi:hypothetical protein
MWHVWWTGVLYTGFWWGDLMEKDHLEYDIGVDGRIILKLILKWDGEACTGLIWPWIGTGGELL